MKYNIEVQMVTGTIHEAKAIEVEANWFTVIQQIGNASHIQLPLSETKSVFLNPSHIVSVSVEVLGEK